MRGSDKFTHEWHLVFYPRTSKSFVNLDTFLTGFFQLLSQKSKCIDFPWSSSVILVRAGLIEMQLDGNDSSDSDLEWLWLSCSAQPRFKREWPSAKCIEDISLKIQDCCPHVFSKKMWAWSSHRTVNVFEISCKISTQNLKVILQRVKAETAWRKIVLKGCGQWFSGWTITVGRGKNVLSSRWNATGVFSISGDMCRLGKIRSECRTVKVVVVQSMEWWCTVRGRTRTQWGGICDPFDQGSPWCKNASYKRKWAQFKLLCNFLRYAIANTVMKRRETSILLGRNDQEIYAQFTACLLVGSWTN